MTLAATARPRADQAPTSTIQRGIGGEARIVAQRMVAKLPAALDVAEGALRASERAARHAYGQYDEATKALAQLKPSDGATAYYRATSLFEHAGYVADAAKQTEFMARKLVAEVQRELRR